MFTPLWESQGQYVEHQRSGSELIGEKVKVDSSLYLTYLQRYGAFGGYRYLLPTYLKAAGIESERLTKYIYLKINKIYFY